MRGPRSNDTPVAISTLSTQILFSKYYSSIKGTRTPWNLVNSKTEAGKYKMSLEHLAVPKYKERMSLREGWGMLKGHKSQHETAPTG